MIIENYNPFKYNDQIDRKDIIGKEIYIHAAFRVESQDYPGTYYYNLSIEIPTDGRLGTTVIGGSLVDRKLSVLQEFVSPTVIPAIFDVVEPKNGRPYNNITFLTPEQFDDFFNQKVNKPVQLSLPAVTIDKENGEDTIAF